MIEGIFGRENYVLAKSMLDVSVERHRALAGNIANVETPGYRRVDLASNFEAQMRAAFERGDMDAVRGMKPRLEADESARAIRKDGNNVQLDEEMLKMNQNSLQYEFLANYVGRSMNSIKTAIRG